MIFISNSAFIAGIFPDFNRNNPLVFYKSVLRVEDIIATTYNSSRPGINLWNPDTSSVWESGGGSGSAEFTIVLNNVGSTQVNYIAICRHNLADQSWTVTYERSNDGGSTWTAITGASHAIVDNTPHVVFFNPVSSANFRIRLNCTATTINPAVISHVKMGVATPLQRRIYSGIEPSITTKKRVIENGSENGQYLGQVTLRSYREAQIQQQNNTSQFVRDEVIDFINHCNGEPFYTDSAASTFVYAWRPTKRPAELVYGWATSISYPVNTNGTESGGMMDWSVNIGATS